ERDGLGGEGIVVRGGSYAEAGGERHVDPVGYSGTQLVQRDVDPGRAHVRAAAALVTGCPGELSDHGDDIAVHWLEWEQVGVVLEQDRALCGGASSKRVVFVHIEHGLRL